MGTKKRKSQPPTSALTDRDRLALADLARYRYLTTPQFTLSRFPSLPMARRRLNEVLEPAGYVVRFRPRALPGDGSFPFIYHLTKAGAAVVAYDRGIKVDLQPDAVPYPRKRQRVDGLHMDHTLAIVQFWISLDLACKNQGITVERFYPEWHTIKLPRKKEPVSILLTQVPHFKQSSKSVHYQPDAAFVLERDGRQALFYLEVDRKTEIVTSQTWPDFTDKIWAYGSLRQHELHTELFPERTGFLTLITTISDRRLKSYQEAITREGLDPLFRLTHARNVTPENLLEPVWHRGDPGDDQRYPLIPPRPTETSPL